MRGFKLAKSYVAPNIQRNLKSFGLVENQEHGFIEAAYYNGLGRYVPQLKRLTLKFCKSTSQSKGVRDFIEQDLLDFTKKNPSVAVYLKIRKYKTGVVVGEYLDGSYHWQNLHKMKREEIKSWLELMTTRSGQPIQFFLKENKVDVPSIQGPWNPFLNKPTNLNVSKFPNEERSKYIPRYETATDKLIKITEELKNN